MVLPLLPSRLRVLAATVAVFGLAAGSVAQTTPPPRDYSISEATSEVLSTAYKTAADAKNHDQALIVLNGQLDKLTDKTGYDAAVLNQIKAQTLLQKSQFAQALEPLERALQLSDARTPTFFDERMTQEMLLFLSQLYFQEAASTKEPRRLNELYDRQVNWDNPSDRTWRISDRDRNEFNALLPFVISELQVAIGHKWQIVVEAGEL